MCSLTKGMSGTHLQRTVPADTVADTSPVNRARGSTTSGSFGGLLRQPPTVWETGRILAEKGGIILRIDTVIGDSLGERSRASAEKGVVVGPRDASGQASHRPLAHPRSLEDR